MTLVACFVDDVSVAIGWNEEGFSFIETTEDQDEVIVNSSEILLN